MRTLAEIIAKRIEELKAERFNLLNRIEGKSIYELIDVNLTELFGVIRDKAFLERELRTLLNLEKKG